MTEQKMSREARNAQRKANNIYRKKLRREAAEARNKIRDGRTDREQIAILQGRPGKSEREINRLTRR